MQLQLLPDEQTLMNFFIFDVAAIGQHHREGGRLQIIKILIAQGIRLESKNVNGWSALITAAFCGEVDIIILLLANGADVDAVAEDGLTALIITAQVCSIPFFQNNTALRFRFLR